MTINHISSAERFDTLLLSIDQLHQEHQQMRDHCEDAYTYLTEFLPYGHPLLVNLRASLNLPQY